MKIYWAITLILLVYNTLFAGTSSAISGTVFEDIRGDGLLDGDTVLNDTQGDQVATYAKILLYMDNGNMVADTNDTLFATTNTDILGNGAYRFGNLPQGRYYVVVDSGSIAPFAALRSGYSMSDIWAEQTYAPVGGICDDGNGTTFQRTTAGVCYGGQKAGISDSNASLLQAQHIAIIDLNGTDAENINFGFSFNVVTHQKDQDDDTANAKSAQGSLRQFIQNANAVEGINHMRFVPRTIPNAVNWWSIQLSSPLPPIADSDTILDAAAYNPDGTLRDLNSGYIHSTQITVGTGIDGIAHTGDEPKLERFAKKELELNLDHRTLYGFKIAQNGIKNVRIANFAIFGSKDDTNNTNYNSDILVTNGVTNLEITNNFIGFRADGTLPSQTSDAHGIALIQEQEPITHFIIDHNYIGYTGSDGIYITGQALTKGKIYQNEVTHTYRLGQWFGDGIAVEHGASYIEVYENFVHDNNGPGFESWQAKNNITWINNTSIRNGFNPDSNPHGVIETYGLRIMGSDHTAKYNIIANNAGAGIVVSRYQEDNTSAQAVFITQNSFYNNGSIAIDLDQSSPYMSNAIGDGHTTNNGTKNSNLQNADMDYPIITYANIAGSTLTLYGYIGTKHNQNIFANTRVELYKVAVDTDSHGEGKTYLGQCLSDANGNIACQLTTSNLSGGAYITALAIDDTGNTSEFGPNFKVTASVPYTCDANAYVFYSDADDQPTKVNEIDLLNATQSTLSTNIYPVNINGIGYNVTDDFIWGYDIINHKVTRTDSNLDTIAYDVNALAPYTFHLGDVSTDGILYLASSYLKTIDGVESDGILRLYRVDVNPSSPTYLQKLSEVELDDKTLYAADFAFHPNENSIYLVERFSGHIFKIDPKSGHVTDLGSAGLGKDIDSHVQFFDKNGYFYFYKSGVFYRSDFTDPAKPRTKAVKFIDMPLPKNGDGARCAYAGMGDKPILSISDAAVLEGHSGTKNINFIITSDRPIEKAEGLYIDFTVSDGSATAGSDYNAFSGTALIPYHETNTTLTLPIVNGDLEIESDEDFFVTLSSSDAFFIDNTGRGVIINDDFNITLNAATVGSPFVDGNLTTQIVNQSFTIMLGAYNETLGKVANDMNITKIDLISPTGTLYENLFSGITTTDSDGIVLMTLTVSKAYKNSYLKIEGNYMGRSYTGRTKDNFAIRPMAFAINIPHNNIAGVPFAINLQALDANSQPAGGYNESIGTSFDLNFTEQRAATCITGTMDLGTVVFSDGNASHTTYYTETGLLDFNLSEIDGSEFAVIDADDTPDTQRFIQAAQTNDINFTINDFEISGLDLINGSTVFTYYAAPSDMQLMASKLRLSLKARNAQGSITRNYTSGCYAKDVMLGIYFDTNTTPTQANTLAWQEDGNPAHGNPAALAFVGSVSNQSFIYDIAKEKFVQGENNTSIKINFNRTQTAAKEPMRLSIRKVAAVNSDNRIGTKTETLSNDFYYGRLHASDYMAIGNKLNAKIFYEVYCDQCDRKNLFTLASGGESVDQVRWYRFSNYLDGISGFSNVTGTRHTIPVTTSATSETITSITALGAISNNTDLVTFTVPSNLLPFGDRIRYLPKPWLIYKKFPTSDNRHSFDIDLSNLPSDWAGKGHVGATVDLNVSGRKGNMKLDW